MSKEVGHLPGDARFLGDFRDKAAQCMANLIGAGVFAADTVYQKHGLAKRDGAAVDLGDLSPSPLRHEGTVSRRVEVTIETVISGLAGALNTARQTANNVRAAAHDLDGW